MTPSRAELMDACAVTTVSAAAGTAAAATVGAAAVSADHVASSDAAGEEFEAAGEEIEVDGEAIEGAACGVIAAGVSDICEGTAGDRTAHGRRAIVLTSLARPSCAVWSVRRLASRRGAGVAP